MIAFFLCGYTKLFIKKKQQSQKNALRNAHNAMIFVPPSSYLFPSLTQQQQPSSATQQTQTRMPTSFFHAQLQ